MDDKNVRFSGLKAYMAGVLGTLIASVFNFYFEFRDGEINLLISAACGILIALIFMLLKGRVTGFKEMLLMIFGIVTVLIIYEAMITGLNMYEIGKSITYKNILENISQISYILKFILNSLLRGMPSVLIVILFCAVKADPVVWNKRVK